MMLVLAIHSWFAISCTQSDADDKTIKIIGYKLPSYTSFSFNNIRIGAISSDTYVQGDAGFRTIFIRTTFQNTMIWSKVYNIQSLAHSFDIDFNETYFYSLEKSASYWQIMRFNASDGTLDKVMRQDTDLISNEDRDRISISPDGNTIYFLAKDSILTSTPNAIWKWVNIGLDTRWVTYSSDVKFPYALSAINENRCYFASFDSSTNDLYLAMIDFTDTNVEIWKTYIPWPSSTTLWDHSGSTSLYSSSQNVIFNLLGTLNSRTLFFGLDPNDGSVATSQFFTNSTILTWSVGSSLPIYQDELYALIGWSVFEIYVYDISTNSFTDYFQIPDSHIYPNSIAATDTYIYL